MQSVEKMQKISFIGSGNVAWSLASFFRENGNRIVEVYSTNKITGAEFSAEFACELANSLHAMDKTSDVFIIAVPDREIEKLVLSFPEVDGIVVHTSGIISMNVLNKLSKYGVFYPLQTFTKGLEVDFSTVPICIEASDVEVENKLISLASQLSSNVNLINSEQRKDLHLSAVFVSNFTNLLYNYADELLERKGLDFQLLIPLLDESVRKIHFIKPQDAQTGPARRNDLATINKHLGMLEDYPEMKDLYSLLSEQIRKRYHE